jgi:hypothetical protein
VAVGQQELGDFGGNETGDAGHEVSCHEKAFLLPRITRIRTN